MGRLLNRVYVAILEEPGPWADAQDVRKKLDAALKRAESAMSKPGQGPRIQVQTARQMMAELEDYDARLAKGLPVEEG